VFPTSSTKPGVSADSIQYRLPGTVSRERGRTPGLPFERHPLERHIPADMYYSALDAAWNAFDTGEQAAGWLDRLWSGAAGTGSRPLNQRSVGDR